MENFSLVFVLKPLITPIKQGNVAPWFDRCAIASVDLAPFSDAVLK